jgi:hypothetical protein
MNILRVLLALIPEVFRVAQSGQAAWNEYLESKKVEGNDELNAQLAELQSEFVRHRILAEHEAGLV